MVTLSLEDINKGSQLGSWTLGFFPITTTHLNLLLEAPMSPED